jgi:hypothetical protein
MAKRKSVSWLLLALGLVGLAVGLSLHLHEEGDPATGYRIREWTLGLSFSPAYRSVREEWTQPTGFTVTERYGINLLSWSGLSILLGAVCLAGWWRWRKSPPPAEGSSQTKDRPES